MRVLEFLVLWQSLILGVLPSDFRLFKGRQINTKGGNFSFSVYPPKNLTFHLVKLNVQNENVRKHHIINENDECESYQFVLTNDRKVCILKNGEMVKSFTNFVPDKIFLKSNVNDTFWKIYNECSYDKEKFACEIECLVTQCLEHECQNSNCDITTATRTSTDSTPICRDCDIPTTTDDEYSSRPHSRKPDLNTNASQSSQKGLVAALIFTGGIFFILYLMYKFNTDDN